MTKNCRDCKYCTVIPENRMTGICTEEHGPRNARGEPGTLIPTDKGSCRYYMPRTKRSSRKIQGEAVPDVIPE